MKILEIYEKYKIMPQLQLHQVRVAAVARQICDNLTAEVDREAVTKACLLHDMGNIIKFDLTVFPDFTQPEGLDYWQKVKKDFAMKYQSSDEHVATLAIAKELNMPKRVLELVGAIGFSQATATSSSKDIDRKICAYSDMRVGPHGVISLEERLVDGAKRYAGTVHKIGGRQDEFAVALRQIENQIFVDCQIRPADITDTSVAPVIEQLKSYEI